MQERALLLRYIVYCDVNSCRRFAAVRTPAREDANVRHRRQCTPPAACQQLHAVTQTQTQTQTQSFVTIKCQ